jgi:BirA family biotin operon repressor/biotin-[acetyl-CoA-carboxylase] ligase
MQTADQIVAALREARGEEVSSRVLCERLGVSRAAVWKHVHALRAAGYAIEACSRRGYRLVGAPDTPFASEVVPFLTAQRMGHDCRYSPETESTNRDAMLLADKGAAEGVVVIAGAQTAGRGRMTRAWFSPPESNLYFSLLLRPQVQPTQASSLPLIVGLAVAEALMAVAPETRPLIKWPNDILIGGRKVCGILCEMQVETDCFVRHIVAGVGVNLNVETSDIPEELRDRATSLRIETGRRFSRASMLAAILNRLEPLYDRWCREGVEPFLSALGALDALLGKRIGLEQGARHIDGHAAGIQADGALLLDTEQGRVPIYSGEAHIGDVKRG